jgi:phage-related protein
MYILIDGIDTQEYKLRVTELPPIQIPQKRVERILIPGRSGYLTHWDGSFEDVIKTAGLFYNGTNPEQIARLILEGSTITFSNEPEFVYDYGLDITTDLTKTISTWHQFFIQFICNPVKREIYPPNIIANSPITLISPCNHPAYPTIKLTGTGDVTLKVGEQEIELEDISPSITIDGWLMECYQESLANNKMTGAFPVINAGESVFIEWTGSVTEIEIKPNWRWA